MCSRAGETVKRLSWVRSICPPARSRSQFKATAIPTAIPPTRTHDQKRVLFSFMALSSLRLPALEHDDVQEQEEAGEARIVDDVAQFDDSARHALEPSLERDGLRDIGERSAEPHEDGLV